MAENPRFNNSGMFTGVSSDNYSDIEPNSTSEVLATQGNVINSIKVFWNKLRAKLAYAVTRGDTEDGVGSNWCPIYVDASGEVKECNATMLTVGIEGTGNVSATAVRDITTPHTGTTAYLNISRNGATNSTYSFTINGKVVKYVSGAEVKAGDISEGDKLVLTYATDGSTGFWLLLNKVNNASAANAITTSTATTPDGSAGLMSIRDKAKLDGIAFGANKYSLPAATSDSLGGVQLGYKENGQNYQVKKDTNNNLFVNVPWTDTDTHNTVSVAMTVDKSDAPNITLTNSDGSGSSSIQVVGLGGTQVAKGQEGQLLIETQPSVTYNNLKDSLNPTSINDIIPVTVPYPYVTNSTVKPTRFLNAEGNWVTPITKLYNSPNGTNSTVTISSGKVTSPISIYTADGKRLFCLFMGTENVAGVVLISSKIPAFSSDNIYIPFFPLGLEEDWYNNPGYDTRFKPGVIRIYKTSSTSEAQVRVL